MKVTITLFYNNLDIRHMIWQKIFPSCYLGGTPLNMTIPSNILSGITDCGFQEGDECKKYLRLKWNGTVYVSKDYTRASKTVNYVALINEGNTAILCTIIISFKFLTETWYCSLEES